MKWDFLDKFRFHAIKIMHFFLLGAIDDMVINKTLSSVKKSI